MTNLQNHFWSATRNAVASASFCSAIIAGTTYNGDFTFSKLSILAALIASTSALLLTKRPEKLKTLSAMAGSLITTSAILINGINYKVENPNFGVEPASLTTGESALLHGIWDNKIDTTIIHKHQLSRQKIKQFFPKEKRGIAAVAYKKTDILFFGKHNHEEDYSKAKNAANFGTFVHEGTHLAQAQANMAFTNGYCKTYKFSIQPSSKFEDFCDEQQATLIENYARRFLRYPAVVSDGLYTNAWRKDTPEGDLALQKLVEKFSPRARRTRLAFEAEHNNNTAAALTM